MRKRSLIILTLVILIAAVVATLFTFSTFLNPAIDKLNAGKQTVPVAKSLPNIPHFPGESFRLGLDLQGGIHLLYSADLSQVDASEYDSAMKGLRDVIERRVNLFGVSEPVVQVEGRGKDQRLIIELAGIQDPDRAIQIIGQTPYLEFAELKPNAQEISDRNQRILNGEEQGDLEVPYASTQLTGRFLERADLGFDQTTQQPLILLKFNEEGSKLFEQLTEANIGKPLAIFLDGQLIQEPIVQSKISGGEAQITGVFTVEEARRISRELNAGALPVPITLISQKTVGATLGKISLEESLQAGLIGSILVVIFMIFFYRFPGVVASLALLLYIIFLLAIFKFISVTFTLAGIAGIILSIGMAVDANILIFSRMREELKAQKTLAGALEEGFQRAWPSIRDGNLTTLLVALILIAFGSSFVKGFAFTLFFGISLSMISAIVITKLFMRLFVGTKLGKFLWRSQAAVEEGKPRI